MADADVVHMHGIWDPVLLAAYRVARRVGRPHVISTHGTLEKVAIARKPWKKRLFWAWGWGEFIQTARAIHNYRPGPLSFLGRELVPPVFEIANGVEEERPAEGTLGSRWEALGDKAVVLYIGRVAPEKGLEVLVEGVGMMVGEGRWPGDSAVVIAGPDYGVYESLSKMPAVRGGQVMLCEGVYGGEKEALLSRAQVFVQPSRGEGFSMSILEAMRAGRPVVMTETCHFPEGARAGAAAEVPVGDARALGEAIVGLLTDPARAKAMGERGAELVRSGYTWPRIVSKYVEMYSWVAEQEKKRPKGEGRRR